MNNDATKSGVSLTTTLVVVFLVLKLTGNIDWSWWWVFAPYWIPFVVIVVCAAVLYVVALIVVGVKELFK